MQATLIYSCSGAVVNSTSVQALSRTLRSETGKGVPSSASIIDVAFRINTFCTTVSSSMTSVTWNVRDFTIVNTANTLDRYSHIKRPTCTLSGSLGSDYDIEVFSGATIDISATELVISYTSTGSRWLNLNYSSILVIVTYDLPSVDSSIKPEPPVLTVTQTNGNYELNWTTGKVITTAGKLINCTNFKVWAPDTESTDILNSYFSTTKTSTVLEIPSHCSNKIVRFYVTGSTTRSDIVDPDSVDSNIVYISPRDPTVVSYGIENSWVDCLVYYGSDGE